MIKFKRKTCIFALRRKSSVILEFHLRNSVFNRHFVNLSRIRLHQYFLGKHVNSHAHPNFSVTSFTISSPILLWASFVEAPMCGVMQTFGWCRRRSSLQGSSE